MHDHRLRNQSRLKHFWIPLKDLRLLLLSLPFFTACLGYKDVVLQDVRDINVEKFDASGVSLRVNAVIENPNGFRIRATDPDVDLFVNGTLIGKALLDSAIVLDRKSTRNYSIPLRAEFKGGSLLMMLLSGALSESMEITARGTVVGRAGLLRKRFPFELTEQLDLQGN